MAKIDFGGVVEEVITIDEFPLERARELLNKETIAILGYGVQGPGQAKNLRDNGINVIVGQRNYEPAIVSCCVLTSFEKPEFIVQSANHQES